MLSITINKSYTDLLKKIRLHLAVIGKRAVNVQGESFYVELTTSAKEDKVFYDLVDAAAETIVSELTDVSSTYSNEDSITFVVWNNRWEKSDEEFIGDLKVALDQAIGRYFVNFALAQFLSAIFPALKETSAPMYGKPYIEHCQVIMKNIKTLAFLKRPDASSGVSYSEMLNANSDYWDDGKIISLLTIKRNSEPVIAYNGTEDKVADIKVPVKVSELTNDKGYLTKITDEMVISVLGYTPLDSRYMSKSNILALSGIYDWALADKKPSYSASEIVGLSDLLALKYDKASFSTDFGTEIKKYNLGHKIVSYGSGDYISNIWESSDKKSIYYQKANLSTSVTSIVTPLVNNILDNRSGSFGTQVAWSTQNGAYIGLNVAGTTKNLLMQGFLENIFIPVDADGNEVGYAANNIYAIKFRHNLFSMGGVTAYGMGSDAESSGGVSNFGDLYEVRHPVTSVDNGKVWGYLNGAYTWLDQSEGKTYTGDGTYISISGTKISFIGSGQFLASGTTTSGIAEGTNLYFTAARAQDALSGHTGDTDIHLQSGERTKWTEAYNKRHEHSNKATLDLIGTDTLVLWGNTVKLNTTNNKADGAITIKNGDKSVTISVDTDGNLKIDNTAGNANLYATGGVSAYGLGLDSLTPVTAFSQLSDISGGTAGQVWGKTQNGYGWVDQSVGAIYSGDGTYISVSGTTISLSSALKTDLSTIRSNALLGSYAYAWGDHSSAGYIKKWSDLNVQQSDITSILGSYYLTEESDPIFTAWRDSTNLSLWGNEVSVNGGSATNKMTLTNGTKTVTIEVDDNGLKIDGDVYATGGITAYGYGKDDQTVVTSFAQLTDIGGGSEGDVWGKTQDGYGWVKQSVGAIYSAGDYISISTANAISVNKNSLLSGYATESWVSSNFNKYELTKAAVEDVLTGNITSHTHSQYLTSDNISGMLTTSNYAATLDSVYAAKVHDHDSVYSKLGHTHTKSDITDFAHTHPFTEITGTAAFSQLPDMYWADVKVSNSSNTATAPKFKQITIDGITLSVVDGNLKINNATNNANVYATGGVSAYGLGLDNLTPVTSFAQLNEVLNTTPTEGQVWGKTENGYGWLNQSEGKTYSEGDYINISDANIISVDKASLMTWDNLVIKPTQSQLTDIIGSHYITEHQSLANYIQNDDSRLTDARVPISHSHVFSDITGTATFAQLPALYWANIAVSNSSNTATSPTFWDANVSNVLYAKAIYLSNDIGTTSQQNNLCLLTNGSNQYITNLLNGLYIQNSYGNVYFDTSNVLFRSKIGIYNDSPQADLDVYGTAHISFDVSTNGVLKLISTTPSVAFYKGGDTSGFNARLLNDIDGGLSISAKSGVAPSLRIGTARLSYDATQQMLIFSDDSGALLNIASTGGITAYGIDGAEIGSLVNLNVSNKVTAKTINTSNLLLQPTINDDDETVVTIGYDSNGNYTDIMNICASTVKFSDEISASSISVDETLSTKYLTVNATTTGKSSVIISDVYVGTYNGSTYLYLKINNDQCKILLS